VEEDIMTEVSKFITIIRPEFMSFCEDACRAATLNHLLYRIAGKCKDQPKEKIQAGHILWYGKNEQITQEMSNAWGVCKVRKEVNELVKMGLFGRTSNPEWGADRTKHFFFGIKQCTKFLEYLEELGICFVHFDLPPVVKHLIYSSNANDKSIKCLCETPEIPEMGEANDISIKCNSSIYQMETIDVSNANDISIKAIPKIPTKNTTKNTTKKDNEEDISAVADAPPADVSLDDFSGDEDTDKRPVVKPQFMPPFPKDAAHPSGYRAVRPTSAVAAPASSPNSSPDEIDAGVPPKLSTIVDKSLLESIVAKTEELRGRAYSLVTRAKELNAAKKLLKRKPDITEAEYERVFTDRNDEWWRKNNGPLNVTDMVVTPKDKGDIRYMLILEKLTPCKPGGNGKPKGPDAELVEYEGAMMPRSEAMAKGYSDFDRFIGNGKAEREAMFARAMADPETRKIYEEIGA
jgi:hypothetical protein